MRIVAWFILFASAVCTHAELRSSFVYDAETGEALPFVNVYATGQGNGTITNSEGAFSLDAADDDTLRISYVGYETLRIAVRDLTDRLHLSPVTNSLGEVVVTGNDALLQRIAKALAEGRKEHKSDRATYYMRQTNHLNGEMQMVEAFIRAHCAVGLSDISFLNGRHYRPHSLTDEEDTGLLWFSNLHNMLTLSPMVGRGSSWTGILTTPFDPVPNAIKGYAYKKRYVTDVERLRQKDGSEMLKVSLREGENKDKGIILCGNLYVDAATLSPIAFDGHLEHFTMKVWSGVFNRTRPAQANIHVGFDPDACRVREVAVTLQCQDIRCQTVVYETPGDGLRQGAGYEHPNMLLAIERSPKDDTLWQKEIVQRTRQEELLASGQMPAVDPRFGASWRKMIDSHISAQGSMPSQEKVYLHLDNNSYFLGDTLRFKAYVRETGTGRPTTVSNVLYVDLLNHDGYSVGRRVVQLHDGEGSGDFALMADSSMYSGFYEIRAYTRWQLNWGRQPEPHIPYQDYWFYDREMAEEYFTDYDKIFSRVVPVYDEQKVPGELYRDMTLRRSMRYYGREENVKKPQVAFFPEGGQLVAGVACNLVFEAKSEEGEYLSGTLELDGQTCRTVNRGRGRLVITPEAGRNRKATFRSQDGQTVTVSLPSAAKEGIALRVTQSPDSVRIGIGRSSVGDTLAVSIRHEGNIQVLGMMASGDSCLSVARSALRCGVNQVSVIDRNGRIWADRLFFNHDTATCQPSLRVEGLKDQYAPEECISLSLAATSASAGGQQCSVAVRESATEGRLYDNGTIMSEMLLSSEIKGFVPDPGWYFSQDDELHREALDLLLLTQGWRRFEWKAPNMRWQPEKALTLYGRVLPYKTYHKENILEYAENKLFLLENGLEGGWFDKADLLSKLRFVDDILYEDYNLQEMNGQTFRSAGLKKLPASLLVHGEFVEGREAASRETIAKGSKFSMPLPGGFRGNYFMHLSASDTTKWHKNARHVWISPNEDEYPEFYVKLNQPVIYSAKPFDFYQTHLPAEKAEEDPVLSLDGSMMRQVSVYGKGGRLIKRQNVPPALKLDAREAFNAVSDAGLMDGWMTGQTSFARAVAHHYIGDMGINTSYNVTILPRHAEWKTITEFFAIKEEDIEMLAKKYNIDENAVPQSYPDRQGYLSQFNAAQYDVTSEGEELNNLSNIDSVYIYTDYAPRRKGDALYHQPNLPEVIVYLKQKDDGTVRATFRDRFVQVQGFSVASEFYHPDYRKHKLPEGQKDYRRTLYWNPNLQLDENGEARVTFYNNSRTTSLSVEAEGQAADGTLLWSR